jgi:hypothetical protein
MTIQDIIIHKNKSLAKYILWMLGTPIASVLDAF